MTPATNPSEINENTLESGHGPRAGPSQNCPPAQLRQADPGPWEGDKVGDSMQPGCGEKERPQEALKLQVLGPAPLCSDRLLNTSRPAARWMDGTDPPPSVELVGWCPEDTGPTRGRTCRLPGRCRVQCCGRGQARAHLFLYQRPLLGAPAVVGEVRYGRGTAKVTQLNGPLVTQQQVFNLQNFRKWPS